MSTGFIDWTDGNLSLYIFEKKGSRYKLVDTASVHFEEELNQSVLASLIKTNIREVYLSVPLNFLSLRELSFPFSDRNKMKETIVYELEGILLGNISDYSVDSVIAGSSDKGSSVLAVCMEKTKLKGIIDLFSSAGLEPVVITSLDLRLSGSNIEMLLEGTSVDGEKRGESAGEELASPMINLRQEDLAYRGDIERIKKSLRFTSVLALLILLILGADAGLIFFSQKKENAALKERINIIYRETFPGDSRIVDVERQFRGNFNSLMEKKGILGGMPVLDFMLDIANMKNSNITLGELNIDENNILIKGTAPSFEDVDSLKTALSSAFSEVKVIDSKSSPDKKISFSLIMKEKAS